MEDNMDNINNEAEKVVQDSQKQYIQEQLLKVQSETMALLSQTCNEQQKLLMFYQTTFLELLPLLQSNLTPEHEALIKMRVDQAQQAWAHLYVISEQSEIKKAEVEALLAIKRGEAL
jgi:hypothetical protein